MKNRVSPTILILVAMLLLPIGATAKLNGTALSIFNNNLNGRQLTDEQKEQRAIIVQLLYNEDFMNVNKAYKEGNKTFDWYWAHLLQYANARDDLNRMTNDLRDVSKQEKAGDYSYIDGLASKHPEGSAMREAVEIYKAAGYVLEMGPNKRQVYDKAKMVFHRNRFQRMMRNISQYGKADTEEIKEVLVDGMHKLEHVDAITSYMNASNNQQNADSARNVAKKQYENVKAQFNKESNNGQNRNLVSKETLANMQAASQEYKEKAEEYATAEAATKAAAIKLSPKELANPAQARDEAVDDLATLMEMFEQLCPDQCVTDN